MARDVSTVVSEMLAAIDTARAAAAGKDFEAFKKDRVARFAIERAIEIISEAARHLPEDVTARHMQVPWSKIKAVGNVLRHEYYHVNDSIIWDVIRLELDSLEFVLRKELARSS